MKTVGVALLLLVLGVFGWHLSLRGEVAERVASIPVIRAVDSAVPVSVAVNPVTNFVTVSLAVNYAAKPDNLIASIARDVGVGLAIEHWPEQIEQELRNHARERTDFYAILFPYRAGVTDPRGGTSRASGD